MKLEEYRFNRRTRKWTYKVAEESHIPEYDGKGDYVRDQYGYIQYRDEYGDPYYQVGHTPCFKGGFMYDILYVAWHILTLPLFSLFSIYLSWTSRSRNPKHEYKTYDAHDVDEMIYDKYGQIVERFLCKLTGRHFVPKPCDHDYEQYMKDWEKWKAENEQRRIAGEKCKAEYYKKLKEEYPTPKLDAWNAREKAEFEKGLEEERLKEIEREKRRKKRKAAKEKREKEEYEKRKKEREEHNKKMVELQQIMEEEIFNRKR